MLLAGSPSPIIHQALGRAVFENAGLFLHREATVLDPKKIYLHLWLLLRRAARQRARQGSVLELPSWLSFYSIPFSCQVLAVPMDIQSVIPLSFLFFLRSQ